MSDSTKTPRKNNSLLRSTALVSSMTMMSRIVGFVRDALIALLFGATAGVDAFIVAFKIPNFMRRLFAEGAFSQAFVPMLAEYQQKHTHEETQQFINRIAGTLSFVLLAVTILAILIAPLLISLFAPGFGANSVRFVLASEMLQITFPYLMLISLTAMCGAILNTYGYFGVPAITPVLLNLCMIAAAVFLAPFLNEPIIALAWGVLLAGIVQLLWQLPFLYRIHLLPKPRLAWRDSGVIRVLKLMVPALFGVSVAQVNLLLDTVFASFLPIGSVSWLYYSDRLTDLPLGVFGVAIATVILPHLSREHAKSDKEKFSQAVDWGLRMIALIALPSAIGLFVLAGPLLATLLGYGHFTSWDVQQSSLSLMALALGMPAFMWVKILASGFYAQQNIKTPVKVGVIAVVANVVFSLMLMGPLKHAGLALATTLSSYINVGVLFWLLYRNKHYIPCQGWGRFVLRVGFASMMLVAFLLFYAAPLAEWLAWSWYKRGIELAILLTGSIVIYLGCLFVAGLRVNDLRVTSLQKNSQLEESM